MSPSEGSSNRKGRVRRSIPSRAGKMMCADGDVCEGDWKDDKLHGEGKFTSADGTVYDGELKNGKMHG